MNFGLPISETSRAGFGLRYQYTNFIAGDDSELAQQFVEENGNVFNDFILSASYTSDSRDTAIFPTKGGLRALRADIAVPGSDLQYYKLTYQEQRYIPLTSRFVVALSGDVGYGEGYGETESLPFFENFYAGGPRSVRGFVANSLGPRETDDDDPVGGNFRMVGSIELFAPAPGGEQLSKTLRLGAFLDFGNVWETNGSDLIERPVSISGICGTRRVSRRPGCRRSEPSRSVWLPRSTRRMATKPKSSSSVSDRPSKGAHA